MRQVRSSPPRGAESSIAVSWKRSPAVAAHGWGWIQPLRSSDSGFSYSDSRYISNRKSQP